MTANYVVIREIFVPMLEKLFCFCNKYLAIKLLVLFSSFNNYICSRKEKNKSNSSIPVLSNSIWFFKSSLSSFKNNFITAICAFRDNIRFGSILLSSVCVEALHFSGVCCVIRVGSVSLSVNVSFTNDVTKKESSPAAVLLLTSLSSFIKPSIVFSISSSVKLFAWTLDIFLNILNCLVFHCKV